MRNLILATVAAVSVVATAPATAQHHGQRYGHTSYGRNRGYANVSVLQRRLNNVLRSLGGIRGGSREQVRREAISLDRQLRYAARNGLNAYEYQNLNLRIDELERRLQSASGNRRYGRNGRHHH